MPTRHGNIVFAVKIKIVDGNRIDQRCGTLGFGRGKFVEIGGQRVRLLAERQLHFAFACAFAFGALVNMDAACPALGQIGHRKGLGVGGERGG
jgi:hypothetical protein